MLIGIGNSSNFTKKTIELIVNIKTEIFFKFYMQNVELRNQQFP
jgi:hypothetical protein